MFYLLNCLCSMVALLGEMNSLEGYRRRLQTLRDCPQVVCVGSGALTAVRSIRETASKLRDALQELTEYLQGLQGDIPSSAIPLSLIDEVLEHQSPLPSLIQKLGDIVDNMCAGSYPLLLLGAYIYWLISMS